MLFNSLPFIFLFLPITLVGYFWLCAHRMGIGARVWLVIASLFFYSAWNVSYLPLILVSMVFNFLVGTGLNRIDNKYKKLLLTFGVVVNVLLLGYFKYIDFIIENMNAVTGLAINAKNIALPLAISFFTFQQIAYLVDSYRGLTRGYNFLNYSLFVTFFPQLIAGPIVAHYEMMPQFASLRNWVKNYRHIFIGVFLFLIGLFKKVVIADYFAGFANIGFDTMAELTTLQAWFVSLSYTIQIYFDFSGYCDMAMGLARMFNINLPINFNSPYKALNIQDFWRRWHITLSRFLRDYIYIPLGGNRRGYSRALANVFMVFLIGGLWHGAAWTFVVWGVLHGLANIVWRIWHKMNLHMNKWLAWFITFNFVNIAWVFFRATSFHDAWKVLRAMFDLTHLCSPQYLKFFGSGTYLTFAIVIALIVGCVMLPNSMELVKRVKIENKKSALMWGCGLAFVAVLILVKMIMIPYTEFIYFNF